MDHIVLPAGQHIDLKVQVCETEKQNVRQKDNKEVIPMCQPAHTGDTQVQRYTTFT